MYFRVYIETNLNILCFLDETTYVPDKLISVFECNSDLDKLFEATHVATDPTVTFVVVADEMDCVNRMINQVRCIAPKTVFQ